MKKAGFFIFVLILFIASRFFVFDQMYHQDEYKWAMLVNPAFGLNLTSDHPPLIGLLYKATGLLFGFEHLRILPIFFSILLLCLVFLYVSRFYGRKAAYVVSGILLINSYYLLASTQVDIDGVLLPLATFLSFYAFHRIDWQDMHSNESRKWVIALILSVIFGFLVKLSFIIPVAVLATEYILRFGLRLPVFRNIAFSVFSTVGVAALFAWLFVSVFNIQNPLRFVLNVTHFGVFNFAERNYFQVLFLSTKAFVLASPLLLVGLFLFLSKEYRTKFRIWWVYFLYNFLFYFVIFDFTNRTIERYMMFLIIPAALIVGIFLSEKINVIGNGKRLLLWSFYIVTLIGLTFMSLFQKVITLPLNPKSAYIEKIKDFDFNFLIPITGGSGPIGFYVSVLYIVVSFALCFALFFLYFYFKSKPFSSFFLLAFVILGISYNLILSYEFVTGHLYGSVNKIAQNLTQEVIDRKDIPEIITYYDIAGYELHSSNKYKKRFYTDPLFAETNIDKFSEHNGYYMVVDFPAIDKSSIYWKYFKTCIEVSTISDKFVSGYVFDCRNSNFSLFGKM